jgi:hypothetical protein
VFHVPLVVRPCVHRTVPDDRLRPAKTYRKGSAQFPAESVARPASPPVRHPGELASPIRNDPCWAGLAIVPPASTN